MTEILKAYLASCTKKVRLCVIDYAGWSTNPEDIKKTMKFMKNVKEMAILHPTEIEVLTRHDLKNKSVLKKFNCRKGTVHRSK
ncbi:hypothetical protein G6F70_001084 [Rhizopus microsporus]|uniref:Uncharacterized protein n=1 Tax=Rhizopus microsporus TaxID=58291 RepID=A0A1X0RZ14_RHIZD|nr:hypothetical protein G6F71_000855 [Rhizopus microsporus]KAG1203781.1 hypothetical protein G6F70_001084 [Rhizopus microsporus]KAG1215510.1 hypothetical protein G6F69_000950 [Rhizopus microsporus]ORE17272.1 hypothetical protein BCV71DRAFT_264921 [Rhizopus microsporus]